jgi:hypothetical protein
MKLQTTKEFNLVTMTEEELVSLWRAWYPQGSGPIGAMRVICAAIEAVAKLRGFNIDKWVENTTLFDQPKDDYVDVMTAEEWESYVECGAFIPDDGVGYWGTETHYNRRWDSFMRKPEGATHVHWYNR